MELNKNNDSQNFNNQILNNKVVVEESQTLLEESEGIALYFSKIIQVLINVRNPI